MREATEAVVVLAKCDAPNKLYGLRTERVGNDKWQFTWAFRIKEKAARNEGYDRVRVKGDISFATEFPGCPYCGGHHMTVCSCGRMGCTVLQNNVFTCQWCGTQGYIGEYDGTGIEAGTDA